MVNVGCFPASGDHLASLLIPALWSQLRWHFFRDDFPDHPIHSGLYASATYTPHPSCYHIPFIPFMALTDHLRVPLCVILYCLPVCLLVCYHILFICLPVSYYVLFIYTLLCVIMHYVCQCLPVYYDYCLCTHSSVCDYTLFMYMFACILLCTIYVLAYL